ncbi:MAG: right-handed parallel beta-helix repeat-containing protein [Candidatus Eisenbacteria bacterium]
MALEYVSVEHAAPAIRLDDGSILWATSCLFQGNSGCFVGTLGSQFTTDSSRFLNNEGIVVSCSDCGPTEFRNTEFASNTGTCIHQAYIYADVLIEDCRFYDNGSAVNLSSEYAPSSSHRIVDSEFRSNELGVRISDLRATVDGCDFQGNQLALNVANLALTSVQHTTFEANGHPDALGGAASISNWSFVDLADCSFATNQAHDGGAIWVDHSSLTMSDCGFIGNEAVSRGGAVHVGESGSLDVSDSVFEGNAAGSAGGAIACIEPDGIVVTGCEFLRCSAPMGSAIDAHYAYTVRLVGTLVAENEGSDSTISAEPAPWWREMVEIEACTLAGNRQSQGACLMCSNGTVVGSIIAFNQGASFLPIGEDWEMTFSCIDIYGNAGGDWVDPISGQLGDGGNVSANPLFCDRMQGVYTLAGSSPCLAENNDPSCPTMGAFAEAGCEDPAPFVFMVRPDGSGDYPTIQAALDFSADRDTVSLADGTFIGPGNRDLDFQGKAVVLRSADGDPSTCVLDCQGSAADPHRAFAFVSGEGLGTVVDGITMNGGAAFGNGVARLGGAIYCADSSPTIRRCIIEGNEAERNGGGINLFHSAALIEDCVIRVNEAPLGGGINSSSSSSVIRRTQVTGNLATQTGGGLRFFSQLLDSPPLEQTTVSGNRSVYGGGVSCEDAVALDVAQTVVWGNCADSGAEFWLADATTMVTLLCSDVDVAGVELGDPGAQFLFDGGDNVSIDPLFCDPVECEAAPTAAGVFTVAGSSPCLPEQHEGDCGLIGAYGVGCDAPASIAEDASMPVGESPSPAVLALTSEPNPFAGTTTIRFDLPTSGIANLVIFDVAGKRVRGLLHRVGCGPGSYVVTWDGRSDEGSSVPDGVYWARLVAGARTTTQRLVHVRQ